MDCSELVDIYDKIVYNREGKVMNRTFLGTDVFYRQWKKLGLSDCDLDALKDVILKNPNKGAVIRGMSGARKLRFAMDSKGKRGGGRVIYLNYIEDDEDETCFLSAYSKKDKADLTETEKRACVKLLRV